eukprot:scaffold303797_cov35-Tisochrysis_lutea.AAC.1
MTFERLHRDVVDIQGPGKVRNSSEKSECEWPVAGGRAHSLHIMLWRCGTRHEVSTSTNKAGVKWKSGRRWRARPHPT